MDKKPDAEHVFDNLVQPLKASITNLFFGISAVGEGAKVFGPPTETFFQLHASPLNFFGK